MDLYGTSKSKLSFIADFTGYFNLFTELNIINRIVTYVESFDIDIHNVNDFRSMYSKIISRCVRERDNINVALEIYIPYCLKHIDICELEIEANKKDSLGFLPSHSGFLGIIKAYENIMDFDTAILYARKAIDVGWINSDDNEWEYIIKRLEKKCKKGNQ